MSSKTPKTYRFAQEKACSPSETISLVKKRWQELGFPELEIVSLKAYDRLGLPVYTCLPKTKTPRPGFSGTFGKGGTEEEALASALMELVERVSGTHFLHKRNFLVRAPEEIKGDFSELLKPFDPVYQDEEILRLITKEPLLWSEGASLPEGEKVLIPIHWYHHIYGTTGWAAGNTLTEALHQALCEIIERHAISTVVEERRQVPTIRQESLTSPVIKEILKHFTGAGLGLLLKDFSLDLKVPTVAAIAYDPKPPHPGLTCYATAGTHPDRELALIRALIELAQHRAQFLYSEKVLGRPGGATYCFPSFESEEDLSFLREGEEISFEEVPCFRGESFEEEINFLVSELGKTGLSAYFVETTHERLGIPAVIAVVPGARLNRPSTKIHPLVLLSRQLMTLNRYARAAELLEFAFEAQPGLKEIPQILCQAARCYRLSGRPEEASRYFELASLKAPYLLQSPRFREEWASVIKAAKK